jgi:hypothetical protein
MRSKTPVGLILLVGLVFVGFGDQFLPPEIGRYSLQTRSSIDQFFINTFPQWKPKTKPHQRTEDAVETLKK